MSYVQTDAETVFMNHDPDILSLVFYSSDYFSQAELLLKNTLSDKEI